MDTCQTNIRAGSKFVTALDQVLRRLSKDSGWYGWRAQRFLEHHGVVINAEPYDNKRSTMAEFQFDNVPMLVPMADIACSSNVAELDDACPNLIILLVVMVPIPNRIS